MPAALRHPAKLSNHGKAAKKKILDGKLPYGLNLWTSDNPTSLFYSVVTIPTKGLTQLKVEQQIHELTQACPPSPTLTQALFPIPLENPISLPPPEPLLASSQEDPSSPPPLHTSSPTLNSTNKAREPTPFPPSTDQNLSS